MRAIMAALLISLLPCASGARTAEQECLALNIYHEARGAGMTDMKAVAHVTLNRVKSSKFPDSICSVVYQKNSRASQFSWTTDGKSDIPRNPKAFASASKVAQDAISGAKDITNGALYFYNWRKSSPKWSRKMKETLRTDYHSYRKI